MSNFESYWQEIINHYKVMEGRHLTGWELYQLSKFFIPYPFPISDHEKEWNRASLEGSLNNRTLPPLSQIAAKPKQEMSLKTLFYQSLLDYKDGKCSKETVDYIQTFI